MGSYPAYDYCYTYLLQSNYDDDDDQKPYVNLTNLEVKSLRSFCKLIGKYEYSSKIEDGYSQPMVSIGIYISIASLFCVLAMALDLLNGFRNRKYWFPTKYFSLNAASITVIAVTMKLQVDLTSPMPGRIEHVAKIGGLPFMCTMMSNFMPSLASMDNKSLLENVIGLSVLVITLTVNIFIQIYSHVIDTYGFRLFMSWQFISMVIIAWIYICMLLLLLLILISSAITMPTSKKILELKYRATIKTASNDQHPQENLASTVEKLTQLVKRCWIMAETSSPQFAMVSNPLSYASGIICAISTGMYIRLLWEFYLWAVFIGYCSEYEYYSVYKWSIEFIFITQSIGIVVGSIAPIFRCFTLLSFNVDQNLNHFFVLTVEKYWTKKLCEWKESGISFLSSGCKSRALLHSSKNHILSICIGLQKVIIISCKITRLIPVVIIIFVIYCSYYFKALKAMLFTPPTASSSDGTNEDLSNYVLLLEDNMQLAERTTKRIADSMNRLIQKAEKKQDNNLLKLLENSVSFDGVEMFDTDQVQSLLSVEHVNSWSLPIVSLTCVAIALPNIRKNIVDNLLKSVGQGLVYTHLVEKSINREDVYVNIRRATLTLWHEVENKCKWLENSLERRAYEGKTPKEIIQSFARIAEDIVNKMNTGMNGESLENENLPLKLVAANSMYRIAQTILHTYEISNLEITEDELFTRLSNMIADILAACLTNIPHVITMRCHESAIEKREASVVVAVDLLGRTTEIIKRLEKRELPNMDPDKMAFIDEWRLHLKQP